MGKSASHPLPPVLNNKFDSMPPNEGTVFDFVFDYKARGQWKNWSDVAAAGKDTGGEDREGEESNGSATFIPTTDSAR